MAGVPLANVRVTFVPQFGDKSQPPSSSAVTDASGKLLLVNPEPGQLGMQPRFFEGPGNFRLDVNLLKSIRVTERVRVQIRADAVGVTNTPQFGNPDTNINSLTFGRITSSTGSRVIVLGGRIDF